MSRARLFRFKKFSLSHRDSAIPLGEDAVLLGAWVELTHAYSILDAGTGCGVIALMCAQRNPHALIAGIDIHSPSVNEAAMNFQNSPWHDRLHIQKLDFVQAHPGLIPNIHLNTIDLIVSNPPFYNSGVDMSQASARIKARHTASFGPIPLLMHGAPLLSPDGSIALIAPAEQESMLTEVTHSLNLHIQRICRVSGRYGSKPNRLLLQAGRYRQPLQEEHLSIYDADGSHSDSYRKLTHDFYLKF